MSRLLHISPNTYPSLKEEHHTKKIWFELSKSFSEYHILARSKNNRYVYENEANIHLHRIPKLGDRQKVFFISSLWLFFLIKKYRITHLLAQGPILGGFNAAVASQIFKIPLMVEIHGDKYFKYLQGKGLLNNLISSIIKYTFSKSFKIRSLSREMTKMLSDYKDKVVLIPNRVDLNLFKPPKNNYLIEEPIKIVSIGRFVEQKGYDIAIKAINKLTDKYKIELHLFGGGVLKTYYKSIIRKQDAVFLYDWVEQDKLINILRRADIYIQPSKPFYGEAMPRTILEAMAMRIPIISTRIAAIPGVLKDNYNSLLIDPEEVNKLINSIELLINDLNLRKKIAHNAYLDVCKNFEWNSVFNRYREEILTMY